MLQPRHRAKGVLLVEQEVVYSVHAVLANISLLFLFFKWSLNKHITSLPLTLSSRDWSMLEEVDACKWPLRLSVFGRGGALMRS